MAKHKASDIPANPFEARGREVVWRKLDDLLLDNKNPRLPDGYNDATQPQLMNILAQDYELADLGRSIAANGYFSEEPLVTIKHATQNKWLVVEGNRRLAALMLLASPAKAPQELRQTWADIAKTAVKPVTEVPTLVYGKRGEITPYLGYRHITGVLPWKPYQKGRYVAQLVEDAKLSFAEIARLIGNRPNTVRELYVSYTLVRQARDEFNLDTGQAEQLFGVFRRAVAEPNVRAYIGLDLNRDEKALSKPLKSDDAPKLQEVLTWIFGSKSKAAAVKDSRELPKLGTVIATPAALAALRASNDLTYAFELSGGEESRLLEVLGRASYQLDQALPMALRHKSSAEVLALAKKCMDTMDELARLLNLRNGDKQ
jgi:hypothetical protein